MRKLVLDIQVGLIAIAVALVVAASIGASTFDAAHHTHDTISVTGSAKKPIDADLVQWSLDVSAEDSDLAPAADRLGTEVRQVRAFLRRGGIKDNEVSLPPLSTQSFRQKVSKNVSVTVYEADQNVEIQTRNIDAVEALGRKLGTLVSLGVEVEAQPIAYLSTRLTQARIEALGAATANAHARAQTIVKGLGAKLGRLRNAQLGVYQVTPRFSTDVAGEGINDTSSRQKDVTAVVTVTFEVKH